MNFKLSQESAFKETSKKRNEAFSQRNEAPQKFGQRDKEFQGRYIDDLATERKRGC